MPKEKSTTELREEKKGLQKRSKEITDKAKGEKRMLSAAEQEEIGGIQCRMQEINVEVDRMDDENRSAHQPHMQPKERFSLRRAIVASLYGEEQREAEQNVINEGIQAQNGTGIATRSGKHSICIPIESRAAFTAANEASTGVIVDTDKQEILLPLEPNLVLSKAGVRMMTGLRGNIMWPNTSKANVFWEGENTEAKDGANTISKGTIFQPKRLTAYVDISEQLLVQENMSVENLVRQLLAVAISQKIEATAFSTEAHDDLVPDGMFQTVPTAVTGAMSWANIVKLETLADCNNALFGSLAYVMHPSLIGSAKTKVKDASGAGGFIFGNDGAGMLNGYRAFRSTNIPSGLQTDKDEYGIVFGDWSQYFLGQWGAINLIVDQYTKDLEATIRIVVNSYWNMGFVRKESFTIGSMK